MTNLSSIISELEALGRSTETLEVVRGKAEAIRNKLNSKNLLARGCEWRPIPSNYKSVGAIPSPYWIKAKKRQVLDLMTVGTSKSNVEIRKSPCRHHSGSTVLTLKKTTSD
jgi:hypothetical protein